MLPLIFFARIIYAMFDKRSLSHALAIMGLVGTLVLAGCNATSTTSGIATTPQPGQPTTSAATATPAPLATPDPALSSSVPGAPSIPPIHTLKLGNLQAVSMTPTPHGIVLFGSDNGASPTNQGAYTQMYFYDFTTQAVRVIATPTPAADGTIRGIGPAVVAGGDWLTYVVYDQNAFHW